MEYKPLCRERDEIRVISIEPSKSYSSGRGTETSWTPCRQIWPDDYFLVPAVRIALAEDLVHCRLEHVSLQDTLDSSSNEDVGSINPGTIEVPAWRLQKDVETSFVVRYPHAAEKPAEKPVPRFLWGDFEALSYTWGEENADGRVVVNGKLCHVQRNLEAALRRLRALPETEHGMKYWIDALCINQKDIPERNAEVKRMREIYERAWSTVVWLGEGTEDRDTACDCISGIGHLDPRAYEYEPDFKAFYGYLKWKPLIDLLGQPYWKRVWVIQELAMNHHNTIFICGDSAFFRKELERTLVLCMRASLLIQEWLDAESDKSMNENQENLFGLFRRVSSLVGLNPHGFHGPSIEDVLSLAQEASSKDIRDKIYGVHGLLPTALSSRIQPQYESPVGDIFQDFSEKLLHECGLEGVLSWGGSSLSLPSWCVDLSEPLSRCHMQWFRRKKANLNRNFPCTYRLSDSTKYLWCHGVFIDTIGSATGFSLRMSDLNRNLDVQQDFDDMRGDYPMVEDEALINTLIETLLLGNPDRSGHQASFFAMPWIKNRRENDISEYNAREDARDLLWWEVKSGGYFGAFDKFRKANSTFKVQGHELKYFFPNWEPLVDPKYVSPETNVMDVYQYMSQFQGRYLREDVRFAVISLVGRALANTTKGHLALIPSKARTGDIIAIVDCPFPIVLRLKGQGYEYIGECYLHGFMDGEAFAGDQQPKVEEILIL